MPTPRKPFVVTPRRLAAVRVNMAKARAARLNMPETYQRARYSALKHGLYVRALEDTVKLLGEDPKEFQAHLCLLERTFLPQDETERRMVRRLAEALWRRLRLYRAQARWEEDALKGILASGPACESLDAHQTRLRAYVLMNLLLQDARLLRARQGLLFEVERQLRVLLRKRAGGDPQFKILARATREELRESEDLEIKPSAFERLAQGGPEVQKIVESIAPEWMSR